MTLKKNLQNSQIVNNRIVPIVLRLTNNATGFEILIKHKR
jgi:hypothetical protein